MTQEEKELVIKDLCARLPYGVKYLRESWNYEWDQEMSVIEVLEDVDKDGYINKAKVYKVEDIKPYLRSLSSMTESERKEFDNLSKFDEDVWMGNHKVGFPKNVRIMSKCVDWLNKKMFDHRGLIPKGLANEAPEGIYNN